MVGQHGQAPLQRLLLLQLDVPQRRRPTILLCISARHMVTRLPLLSCKTATDCTCCKCSLSPSVVVSIVPHLGIQQAGPLKLAVRDAARLLWRLAALPQL